MLVKRETQSKKIIGIGTEAESTPYETREAGGNFFARRQFAQELNDDR